MGSCKAGTLDAQHFKSVSMSTVIVFMVFSCHCRYSKQLFLQDVPNPVQLPDGSLSFMDFMGSRLNRYQNPDAASKNRVHPPSKTLYYWNAPVDWTEDEIKAVNTAEL